MPVNPNPQGKGLVPVLQGLNQHRLNIKLPPKQIDQVEMELFTSLFVLQSDIKFNPVPHKSYWLYQCEGRFRLLMVAPDEWVSPFRGRFIGECILQEDRTWTLALDPPMEHDQDFMALIGQQQDSLHQALEDSASIEDALPKLESSFSFYAQILAFTLGKSLDISMQMSGIKGLSYSEAKGLLSHKENSSAM